MENEPRHSSQNQTKVLVCFAVSEEAAPFKRLARRDQSIAVLVTGMGRLNARKSVVAVLEKCRPNFVITSGFAGALNPNSTRGEIVGSWDPEFPGSVILKSNAKLVRFLCSEIVLSQSKQKRELFDAGAGDAVEMESEVIRRECASRGIPSATLRVILDLAEENLPVDFEAVLDSRKEINWIRFGIWLLKNPLAIPKLIAFNKQVTFCATTLGTSLWTTLRAAGNQDERLLRSTQPEHENHFADSQNQQVDP